MSLQCKLQVEYGYGTIAASLGTLSRLSLSVFSESFSEFTLLRMK